MGPGLIAVRFEIAPDGHMWKMLSPFDSYLPWSIRRTHGQLAGFTTVVTWTVLL